MTSSVHKQSTTHKQILADQRIVQSLMLYKITDKLSGSDVD